MPTEIDKKLIDEAQSLANRNSKMQFLQANYLFLERIKRSPELRERVLDAIVEILDPLCPKLSKPTINLVSGGASNVHDLNKK